MKLSKEMVEGMGGMQSEQYQEFRKQCYTAFLHLRRSETGHTSTHANGNNMFLSKKALNLKHWACSDSARCFYQSCAFFKGFQLQCLFYIIANSFPKQFIFFAATNYQINVLKH